MKKEGNFKDYYVWVEAAKGSPPNNWVSENCSKSYVLSFKSIFMPADVKSS